MLDVVRSVHGPPRRTGETELHERESSGLSAQLASQALASHDSYSITSSSSKPCRTRGVDKPNRLTFGTILLKRSFRNICIMTLFCAAASHSACGSPTVS